MTTDEKCREIIKAILSRCDTWTSDSIVVSFGYDWGGNSMTIYEPGKGHTHVGGPRNPSFDQLVSELHGLLTTRLTT